MMLLLLARSQWKLRGASCLHESEGVTLPSNAAPHNRGHELACLT